MATAVAPVVAAEGQDWRAGLPEEIRSDKSLESFKGIADVAKGFIETKKMMGSAIKLPKADAPDTEWEPIYSKLGRPESADKYEFKRPDKLPEGMTYDEKIEGNLKEAAHKAGLSTRQAQQMLDFVNGTQLEKFNSTITNRENAVNDLKKQWGNEYDKKLTLALRGVNELGDHELKAWLNESGMGDHPQMVKLFAKLATARQEDTLIVGDGAGDEQGAALDGKIIEARKKASDGTLSHQERQLAVSELTRLSKLRYSAAQ